MPCDIYQVIVKKSAILEEQWRENHQAWGKYYTCNSNLIFWGSVQF